METVHVKSGYHFYALEDDNKAAQEYYVLRCDCANCGQNIAVYTYFQKKPIGCSTVLKDGTLPNFCPFCGNSLDKFDF